MKPLFRKYLLDLPRPWKRAILLGFDFVALAAALWVAFCLRYDTWAFPATLNQWLLVLAGIRGWLHPVRVPARRR